MMDAIGYIILTTVNEQEDVLALLSQIYEDDNMYVIHIDAKDPDGASHLTKVLKQKYSGSNFEVISTQRITWGGFTMLLAELDMLAVLLKMEGNSKYVMNLAGDAALCLCTCVFADLANWQQLHFQSRQTNRSVRD